MYLFSAGAARAGVDPYGRPTGAPVGAPAGASHLDQYGRPQQSPDARSKSVTNLPGGDPYPRPAHSTSTLPRHPNQHMQQQQQPPAGATARMHPGAQQDANRHLSQPDLSRPRDPRDDANDYENYPGPQGRDPRHLQHQQPDYVNQHELKAQGSQSMQNLRGAAPGGEDANHSRVFEWQQRNEMAATRGEHEQWQHQQPPPPGGAPSAPGQYHSLQRALDPQSTLRGQKLNPRASQDPRDPRFAPQQHPGQYPGSPKAPDMSQQRNYPSSPSAHQQQPINRHMPPGQMPPGQGPHGQIPPGHMQRGQMPPVNMPPGQMPHGQGYPNSPQPPNATYQNIPAHSGPAGQQTRRQDPQHRDPASGQRTASPDFPPPPDVTPDRTLERNLASHDDFPPPPPHMQAGNANQSMNQSRLTQQPSSPGYQQNYQNLPPPNTNAHVHDRRPDSMYAQPPPGADTTLGRNNHISKSTGSLDKPANQKQAPPVAGKKPPPIAAKPKLNLAEVRKGFTQSPWEREEKEREKARREAELMMIRDNEIQELESKTYLSHEEQDRLRR